MGVNLTEGDNMYLDVVLIFLKKCHLSVRMFITMSIMYL